MEERTEQPLVEHGSGNVFADIGFEDADDMLAKAKLSIAIKDVIKARQLNQTEAAAIMGIDQPKVSKIVHGRLSEFSTNRLLGYLILLGLDVDIVVHKSSAKENGHGTMNVAYV